MSPTPRLQMLSARLAMSQDIGDRMDPRNQVSAGQPNFSGVQNGQEVIDDAYGFLELDEETRGAMLSELEYDIATHGHPYRGKGTLTPRGIEEYTALLRDAIATGNETDVVTALNEHDRVASSVADAARRLGRTEFNRYYIRGICLRANAHGTNSVVVYRAHGSDVPRPGSQDLVGREQSAPRILANLRGCLGSDTETGLGRVNSGLSARCGCAGCLQR